MSVSQFIPDEHSRKVFAALAYSIVLINDQLTIEQLLFSPQELDHPIIGKTIHEAFQIQDNEMIQQAFEETNQHQKAQKLELEGKNQHELIVWELIFIPLNNAKALVLLKDITASQDLFLRYRWEAAFMEHNPAPVFQTTPMGYVLWMNPAAKVFLDLQKYQGNVFDFFPAVELEKLHATIQKRPFQFEFAYEDRIYQFTVKQGSTTPSLYFYGSDVTPLKQTEEELRKFSVAIAQSASSILFTDIHGNITFANRAFEEHSGFTREEVLGKNPRIFKTNYHSPEVYQDLWQTIAKGKAWKGEFYNRRKDGSKYWENAVITPILDEGGKVLSYVAIKEDVTIRKQQEKELRLAKQAAEVANKHKSDFLANMSHEIRTPINAIMGFTELLLEEENDQEKKERLEIISKSGRHLLSIVNDILDFSKIEAGQMQIEKTNFAMADLQKTLKEMFALQTKKKNLYFEWHCLHKFPPQVYGDVYRINQVLINILSNAIKFTEVGGVFVHCDYNYATQMASISVRDTGIGIPQDKLATIFSPFKQVDASTTRKYGGTGLGMTITKKLVNLMGGKLMVESEPNKGSVFTVEIPLQIAIDGEINTLVDNDLDGHFMVKKWLAQMEGELKLENISRDAIARFPQKVQDIQIAFKQNDWTSLKFLAHEVKGVSSNLGMQEIYEIAAEMEKKLQQESIEVDEIAQLVTQLKQIKDKIPDEYLQSVTYVDDAMEIDNEAFRVLVAEDNLINQKLMQTLLHKKNIACDVVGDGQAVLDQLEKQPYHLLLLDMEMPIMDGWETMKHIRNDSRFQKLYIIALTGHTEAEMRSLCKKAGCDDYLSKPIQKELLYQKIERQRENQLQFTSQIKLAQNLSAEQKQQLVEFVDQLKGNLTIFKPKEIKALGHHLCNISQNEVFVRCQRDLLQAAESFDDRLLKPVIAKLEYIIHEI